MIYKIGLITDLHDTAGDKLVVVDTINEHFTANDCDACIAMGDMMEGADATGIANLWEHYYLPAYWVRGNHDQWSYAAMETYQQMDNVDGDFRVDFGNWTILCFNDVQANFTSSSTTKTWLADQLSLCIGRYVVIISHAPFNVISSPTLGIQSPDWAELQSILDNAMAAGVSIRLALFGHGHNSNYSYLQYNKINGITHFEINNASEELSAAILNLNDNGAWSIDAIGSQCPLCDMASNNTFFLTSPKTAVEFSANDAGNVATGDHVIIYDGRLVWGDSTGSFLKLTSGAASLYVDGVTISGVINFEVNAAVNITVLSVSQ